MSVVVTFLSTLALSLAAGQVTTPASSGNPVLEHCLVSIKDEVQIPAQEPGVLMELTVREGSEVREGDLLGKIDDSERQMQKRLAMIELESAQEQAENDINVRYSVAATRVAEAEYLQAVDANDQVQGTFPAAEIRRLKLAWHRAELQIDQSKLEQRVARFTAQTRQAEVEATDVNIERRKLKSPIDGEVVTLLKHKGEWATPGDPVLRVVRFDTLRVEGFVNAARYDPGEVANRTVTVNIDLARKRRVSFPGRIVHVSPLVQAGGEYRVWAEVSNRQENGAWLMRPGLNASMTIHLDKPAAFE